MERIKHRRRYLAASLSVALAGLSACTTSGPQLRDHAVYLLHDVAEGYKAKAPEMVLARYAPDAAIVDPGRNSFVEASVAGGIATERVRSTAMPRDLQEALAIEFARYQKVHKAKYVLEDARELPDGTFEVDAWFNLKVTCTDGSRSHEESWHTFHVDSDRDDMRVLGHTVKERRVVEGSEYHFVDRSAESGITHVHNSHAEIGDGTPVIPGNFSGSGASGGDIDGDGDIDLLIGDGTRSRLYTNNGDGTFVDVTDQAFGADIGMVRGAYLVDLDDDGDLDALFTRVELPLAYYRNKGDGTFTEASEVVAGVEVGQFESAGFADLDGDGDLDGLIARYGDWTKEGWASPIYQAEDGTSDALIRNDDGILVEVDAPEATPIGWGLAIALADYDNDGDTDLYICNDFGNNHLIRNDGNWKFTEVTDETGTHDQGYGMSAAFGDHDNDGDLDLYISNMHSSQGWVFEETNFPLPWMADFFNVRPMIIEEMRKVLRGNTLLQQGENGAFEQIARSSGTERNGWAWGANFVDYDNDGDLDIYSPNGYITGEDPEDC